MTSLRYRLFGILVVATGLIWLSAAAWIYFQTKYEVEHVLDTRLQEAARMVSSLVIDSRPQGSPRPRADLTVVPANSNSGYERQLSCQIWSLDGQLVAQSSGSPKESLSDREDGFTDRVVDGEFWRVYTIKDAEKGVRVMVGDRLGLRERLVTDLIKGLLAPTLLILPLLALLIWTSLGRGLQPLHRMADDLQGRDADDMSEIDVRHSPREIRPVADALNNLFRKVDSARRYEREMSAFAAHELRTPLAGLKTQAQIAIAATDPAIKERALRQIVVAIDRTTRLVKQLLAIAKVDSGSGAEHNQTVNVGEVLDEVIEQLQPKAGSIRIERENAISDLYVQSNREILTVALRNLHENAIQYTPSGGRVSWRLIPNGTGIFVEDDGPGIPDDELPLVGRRFYRGRHKNITGSGLGLAIVEVTMKRMGAELTLANREGQSGLKATIAMHGTTYRPRRA